MAGALSKRQQARNEKQLQELVHKVPGNNVCADCQASNPAWASWSLGIFLCMRCAAIHRKLGTHISKVKSLSMDSWSNEQVDNMRKVGNIASNKRYNPQNKMPPVPVDIDEADSAMERFIRAKYVTNTLSNTKSRHHATGSSESDDIPPPPPPKTPGRFGFRSASSIFPLSSRNKKDAASPRTTHSNDSGNDLPRSAGSRPPTSPLPRASSYPRPDSRANKASQVFGASVQYDGGLDDLDSKLIRLRDMGFTDERKNVTVLRAVSGNMDKAIEALVRLGDNRLSPNSLTSPRESSLAAPTRTLTPSTANSGLSVPATSRTMPTSPASSNYNPFDMLDLPPPPPPPQSSQSTGTLQTKNPYSGTNPFDVAPSQQRDPFVVAAASPAPGQDLSQAFQNMSLSAPQPLFPHHTGGLSQQQQQQQSYLQQPQQQALLQPPYQTPSPSTASAAAQNYFSAMPAPASQPAYPQTLQASNPFFSNGGSLSPSAAQPQFLPQSALQPAQPAQQQLSLSLSTTPGAFGANPFTRSPTYIQSPSLGQIPEQVQTSYFGALPQSNTFPMASANPYGAAQPAAVAPQPPQMQPYMQQPPPQPQLQQQINNPFAPQPMQALPQAPPVHNAASIMALYNMPKPASQPPTPAAASLAQPGVAAVGAGGAADPAALAFPAVARSATSPLPAASNPFMAMPNGGAPLAATMATRPPPPPPPAAPSAGAASVPATALAGGRSRESMMAIGLEWTNGRHSPDAFASLSARHY